MKKLFSVRKHNANTATLDNVATKYSIDGRFFFDRLFFCNINQ